MAESEAEVREMYGDAYDAAEALYGLLNLGGHVQLPNTTIAVMASALAAFAESRERAGMERAAQIAAAKYASLHEMRSRPYVSERTFEKLEAAGQYVNSVERAIRAAMSATEETRK